MSNNIDNFILKVLKEAIDPQVVITKKNTLSGGCINNAIKVDTNQGIYFIKYNQNCPPDLFVRAAEGLRELRKASSGLIIPEVITASELNEEDPAVLVMDYLSPVGNALGQDEKLGQGLAGMHRYTQEKYGFYHNNYCGATLQNNQWNDDWVDFFGRQRIGYLVEQISASRGMNNADRKTYEQLVYKLPQMINHHTQPALIHGDLWSGNYMNTANGPALIDPACSYSDREFELSITNMFGGFSQKFWSAYENAYPLEPGWKERNQLYMLYHYLNHYYLFGGYYGQQALQIAKRFL